MSGQVIDHSKLHTVLHPSRRVTLAGAASAAMAKQGQFQALTAETPIVDNSDAENTAGDFRLRMRLATVHGGPDRSSLLKLYITPASGNFSVPTVTTGTIRQPGPATGLGVVTIQPNADGEIDVVIRLSAGAATVAHVIAEHRYFVSIGENIASAAA